MATNMTLETKMSEAHDILDSAIEGIATDGKELRGVVLLFSGGNDSTTLGHFFRDRVTHAAHANTTIGIEETRQFVRDTCEVWGLPLLERTGGPGNSYREIVLDQGFPGPAHHWKMYQRLKERALRQVRRELVDMPRRQRVIFVAGRRRDESLRRADIPTIERDGSVVWVSPFANWTGADLAEYRDRYDVPRNEVADHLHMSGECLCGAFAKATSWPPSSFSTPLSPPRSPPSRPRSKLSASFHPGVPSGAPVMVPPPNVVDFARRVYRRRPHHDHPTPPHPLPCSVRSSRPGSVWTPPPPPRRP